MADFDADAVREQMAEATYLNSAYARIYGDPFDSLDTGQRAAWREMSDAALPVAVRAVTDAVRVAGIDIAGYVESEPVISVADLAGCLRAIDEAAGVDRG